MHDLSLALEVCRRAERMLVADDGIRLTALGVDVGAECGVELENFRFCLETLLKEPPFNGTRAELTPVEGDDLRLSWVEVDDGR